MAEVGEISLEGMEFFAYHGYYDEEQKVGNKYSVDIFIRAPLSEAADSDSLSKTINYEDVYAFVSDEMQTRTRLLETVGKRIIEKAFLRYPQAVEVRINISKFNPPVGGICKRARVSLVKTR